ncbi:hypothetical protein K525DRAFT_211108 [Schizophyllum commune Loenen D]|nr:hypothetical protein K525DRAFT_211108 [Schizophyllum commune Loenen D]
MEVGPAEADAYAGVDVLVDIIALLRPAALSAVVVRDLFDSDRFRHCCKGIRAYCAVDVLRVIDLTMSHERVPTHLEDIRPLLAFHALESLSLTHCLFHPLAGDVADMGRSWPCLRVLRLSDPRSETEYYQHFLPFELLLFAQHFPLLEELHARLDMTGVEAIDSSPLPISRAHGSLRKLCAESALIGEAPELVASFLTRFFPNLLPDGLSWKYHGKRLEEEHRWSLVRKLMPVFLSARRTGIHGEAVM